VSYHCIHYKRNNRLPCIARLAMSDRKPGMCSACTEMQGPVSHNFSLQPDFNLKFKFLIL